MNNYIKNNSKKKIENKNMQGYKNLGTQENVNQKAQPNC